MGSTDRLLVSLETRRQKVTLVLVIPRDVGRVEASSSDKVEKKPRKQAAWDIHIYCSKESQITGQKTAVTFTPNRNRKRHRMRPNVML